MPCAVYFRHHLIPANVMLIIVTARTCFVIVIGIITHKCQKKMTELNTNCTDVVPRLLEGIQFLLCDLQFFIHG